MTTDATEVRSAETQADTAQTEQVSAEAESHDAGDGIRIPVKFNKEIRELTVQEAGAFAQKGMKYDRIAADYDRLKKIAIGSGRTVGGFLDALITEKQQARREELLQKCGGDAALAEHFLALETEQSPATDNGFAELQSAFPEITSPAQLPASVTEAAETRGTNILDEYLRYLLREKQSRVRAEQESRAAGQASIGSQQQYAPAENPADTAFIRAIWGK